MARGHRGAGQEAGGRHATAEELECGHEEMAWEARRAGRGEARRARGDLSGTWGLASRKQPPASFPCGLAIAWSVASPGLANWPK
jgi:hypothetical protein